MNAVEPRHLRVPTTRPSSAHPARDWLAARCQGSAPRGAVLVHAPSSAFQAPGGGENQLVQTAWHLEALGLPVRPFCPWTDRLADARLIHLFGMSHEGLELARVARSRRVPVVLSPICWLEPRAGFGAGGAGIRALRDLVAWTARCASPWSFGWRAELLALADAILPNSQAEGRLLARLYGADPARVHVVPNGVASRFATADPEPFRSAYGPEDYVLYVGRIEPRKNLLGLIRALRSLGRPLVVLGDVVPGHERYGAACRQAGRGSVRWLPRLDHDDPRLASAYAAARVFALPSRFETPGLAALEAALAGCAVVITPRGATREYFGDRVLYARPERPREIARAVAMAWDHGPDPGLARHVHANFLWSEVARKTAEVYAQIAP